MQLRRPILWLLLTGTLVHGLATLVVRWRTGRIDAYAFSSLDCGEYYTIARNLVAHFAFSAAEAPPFVPDTWRTPGYPLFLAVSMFFVGSSPTALVLIQQILAALNVVIFFRLACRHMSRRRAAIVAVLFLFEPYGLYYSFWLLSTTWFTTSLLATWWAFERAGDSRRMIWFAATGLLCGLLVLVWPGAVLVPFAVLVGLLFRMPTPVAAPLAASSSPAPFQGEGREVRVRRLPAVATFLACCTVVISSWMARNLFVAGHFALSHQSGIVLAYFKATEVELWRLGRTRDRYVEATLHPDKEQLPHVIWDEIDANLRERMRGRTQHDLAELKWPHLAQGNKTPIDSFEISRVLTDVARPYFMRSPWATAACCMVRVGENLAFPLGLAIERPAGVEVNPFRSAALGAVYVLLATAWIAGMVRAHGRRRIWLFPLSCVIALALTTTPQIDPRFRVPMVPLMLFVALIPGAGAAAQPTRRAVRRRGGDARSAAARDESNR